MSLESDNARRLVQELLAAEKPHHKATLPILAYSTRSLGNAFSELEDELIRMTQTGSCVISVKPKSTQ